MKIFIYFTTFLVLLLSVPSVSEASGNLQAKIDAASAGTTVEIEAGEYNEVIVVSKSIVLEGKGDVLLYAGEATPVLTIKGDGVTLKNIKIEQRGKEKDIPAIYMTGANHLLKDLDVETYSIGIELNQAKEVTIQDSTIIGNRSGNGIDLWKSHENNFQNLKIINVTDGIYLEQSNGNTIVKNTLEQSRYGIHLMFSDDNEISENTSENNTAGIMVMEAERSIVSNNNFYSNKNNVNAQGLLLYSAYYTQVTGNRFIANRIGIYSEKAENNEIAFNEIRDNFVGIQFKESQGNNITNNTFVGNINDAQAIESSNNQMKANYWDVASKIDRNGDGKSDIAFAADPYFLTLTANVPEYTLFFQAPGLVLLQNMLKSPEDQLLIDTTPLIDMTVNVEKQTSSPIALWTMGMVMLLASSGLFIVGRKRK